MSTSGRLLFPSVSDSRRVGRLGVLGSLVYVFLIAHADDQGRVCGNTGELRSRLFPHLPEITTQALEAALHDAEAERLVIRYVDGQALTQIVDWPLYQGRLRYKRPSDFEAPSGWRDVVLAKLPGGEAAYHAPGSYDAVVCPACGVQDKAAARGLGWLCRGCGVELTGVASPRPKVSIGRTRLAGKAHRTVLVALSSQGPMTKRQLADHTGLVVRSLDAILAALRRDGKVDSERGETSRSGWVYRLSG